jgi:hypothetical protein
MSVILVNSKVVFATVAATSFSVDSSTQITAVSPAQPAGAHSILVTTPGGTSAAVTADQFTYKTPVSKRASRYAGKARDTAAGSVKETVGGMAVNEWQNPSSFSRRRDS